MAVFLLIALLAARSQTPPQPFGSTFLFIFPDTLCTYTGISSATGAEAAVVLFANETARVSLTAPGFSRTVTVPAGGHEVVSLASAASGMFIDRPNVPASNPVRVESDKPISVICYYLTPCGSEAFTPLPVEAWGRDYLAATLPGRHILNTLRSASREEGFAPVDAPSEIIVVAAEDGTVVTIDPAGATVGPSPRSLTLNAGEAYLIESTADSGSIPDDLTGTRITSTKPIGVLCGNTRSNAGESRFPELLPTGNSTRNSSLEWLAPTSAAGGTFLYVPALGNDTGTTDELVRIVAVSPGTTAVTTSGIVPWKSLPEGSFAEFRSTDWNSPGNAHPLAFHTDRPARAFLTTGADAVRLAPSGSADGPINSVRSRASATTELLPYERWVATGRFYAPPTYPSMRHYILIAADDAAHITLDARDITNELVQVQRTPFRTARIEVSPGAHTLTAIDGRFTATSYGIMYGYEEVRPMAANKAGDRTASALTNASYMPHPTEYQEAIGAAYAYSVPGTATPAPGDSLSFKRVEKCDSASITVSRSGSAWTSGSISIESDPSSRNMALLALPIYALGVQTGYRLRLSPQDPTQDAEGTAILTNRNSGRTWALPYSYSASALSGRPIRLSFIDTTFGRADSANVTLTNRRPFTVTVLSVRTTSGGGSIGLSDPSALPRTLAPGDSFDITVRYSGTGPGGNDTLIVNTDCTPLPIPIETGTSVKNGSPHPAITGYDWKLRSVGTTNDTIALAFNTGNALYRLSAIRILSDPSGAFTLVDPPWRRIDTIEASDRFEIGIRFRPPFAGEFTSMIELTTTEGESVQGILHGIGTRPGLVFEPLDIGDLCVGTSLDTALLIRNTGAADIEVLGVETNGPPTVRISLDTVPLGLPHRLRQGQELPVGLRIEALALGTVEATLTIRTPTDTVVGTSFIAGSVGSCSERRITVNDHDFDTVWVTLSRPGHVTLRNIGSIAVNVTGITLVDDNGSVFEVTPPRLPFMLESGGTNDIACSFSPRETGTYSGRIRFETEAGTLYALLRGVGDKLIVPAHIARDYHAMPGEEVTVALVLDKGIGSGIIDSVRIRIGYDPLLLGLRSVGIGPGEEAPYDRIDGIVESRMSVDGGRLTEGTLVRMRFLTGFCEEDSSEFPFTLESGLPYVEFVEHPGLFVRDPICGLQQRLFEWTEHGFRLEQNVPNPTSSSTEIEFEIAFEQRTRLTAYDMLGRIGVVLVDEILKPGVHSVTIPSGTLPPGIYTYELRSGDYRALRRMVVY